ncbi:M1 family metallopeptidase [Massilia norwichensis]|uniref:Aminopeptidase n=1 Tax=Massilia norwichensis TaxID=1442366 RepID=A0ABT2A3T4_9BURK|nr:M1 family metallopeptidase [Massilia norwichensis]MCS0588732.1 M1 family metallopeptidase [Massilia norwichensis]
MRRIQAIGATALALAAIGAHAEAPYSFDKTPGKLPKDVIPVEYAAHLAPDIAANTFSGTETVEIDVLRPTSTIMLNAAALEIDSASLSGKGIETAKLTPVLDEQQETLRFTLPQALRPGRYRLELAFRGKINREGRGLFYVNYQAGKLDKKLIATTMEPTDARRMLPTWDEPSFRARFRLSVDLPAGLSAYSNTPVDKQAKIAGGKQRISFKSTPKMPSYLVVLAAGEFERISTKQDGVEIGVVTTEGKKDRGQFALNASRDLLHFYNNYFGVPYPLAKLDQIAIPNGFNGAMENWGGIVYNENTLLYDPKTSPEHIKQLTFSVNAHEMAHQWFGNLVTMAWWDNLWLNEGFASWMASKATEHFHPEWRPYLANIGDRERVMNLDARKTTHPIQTPVETEAQAADAFDDITYEKGQAFLRMLEAYLGEDAFRKGIRAYMAKHQYSNTTSADLWTALERASGKPVGKLASDWTTQPGFPLIKVEQTCDDGKRKVTLSQQQFRLDEPATENRLWNVPLQVGTVNGKTMTTLLTGASTRVMLPGCEGTLVVDPHSVGYFRIQYDRASFGALASQAARLPDATRLKLLNDTWTQVTAGSIPLDAYLKLAGQLADEPRLAVWEAVLGNLGFLDALARGEPERPLVRRFIVGFAKPKLSKLGWDEKPGETAEDAQLRALLAGALARSGDEEAIAQALSRFQRWLDDPASVSPAMIGFVTSAAGRYADEKTFDAIARRMQQTQNNEERSRLLGALIQVQDPALADKVLQMALLPTTPPTMVAGIVQGVGRSHLDQAWNFAVANREQLMKTQDAVNRNRAFPGIVGASSNVRDAERMEDFVRKNFEADAQVEAQRVASGVRVRAAQKARLLPQVREALSEALK